MYDNAIFAATSLQKCVSLSFTEAQYLTLAESVKIMLWLRNMLDELGVKEGASTISQDDNGCLHRATEWPAKHFNQRKHIDSKHNFEMAVLKSGKIQLVSIRTTTMVAQSLTKPLSPTR